MFCPHDGTLLLKRGELAERWVGQVLEDRYRILSVLGQGGMGVVYLGEHLRIGKEVAIKFVNAEGADPMAIRRLEREARTVALIGHENIVSVLDFGTTSDGSAFLVMERLYGETLEQRLAKTGAMELPHVCHILVQAAFGVEAAHHCGVIHRDLKPGNIFLAEEHGRKDVVKVLDFGVAALERPMATIDVTDSGLKFILGTPGYLAPEQARCEPVDARTDVFALGITMYEMLCGESPFKGDDPIQSVIRTLNAEPLPLSQRVKSLPVAEQVDELLRQVLQKHPDARLPSMKAFRSVLIDLRRRMGEPTRRNAEHIGRSTIPIRPPLVGWVSTAGQKTVVELSGCLDERADLMSIQERIVGPEVIIKLSRITRINSAGLLAWNRWLRALIAKGFRLSLHEVANVLVAQANTDHSFLENLPVISFYAPYYCDACGGESLVLVTADDARQRGLGRGTCRHCGGTTILDEVERTYLLFLTRDTNDQGFSDRRRYVRVPLDVTTSIEYCGVEYGIEIVNVSMTGVLFTYNEEVPLRIDDELVLRLPCTAKSNAIALQARVVRTTKQSDRFTCGAMFLSLAETDRIALEALLSAIVSGERSTMLAVMPEMGPSVSHAVTLKVPSESKSLT